MTSGDDLFMDVSYDAGSTWAGTGTVKLVGTDKNVIIKETNKLLNNRVHFESMSKAVNPYGDGTASKTDTRQYDIDERHIS